MSRFPFRPFPSRAPTHRRNGKIRAREVRVLDELKQPLGVMSLAEALRLAQSRGLDLIEIAANATPPVCRIIEYGKFQYEEAKRKKESGSKQPSNQMKELQLSANIDEHDFRTKLNHAIDFLSENLKVRVKLRFRGRQRIHKEFGFEVVNRFLKEAAEYGKADSPPRMLGDRDMHVTISPLRNQRQKPRGESAEEKPAPPSSSLESTSASDTPVLPEPSANLDV